MYINSISSISYGGRLIPMVSASINEAGKYKDYAIENGLGIEIKAPKEKQLENFDATVGELKEVLEGFPNKISVHAPCYDLNIISVDPKIREISRERFEQALEIAQAARADTIVFHTSNDNFKLPSARNKAKEELVEFWSEFVKKLEELNITAMLENVLEASPELIQQVVKEVNSPYLKTCFDTGHALINSSLQPEIWFEKFKDSLGHIHIHNNDGEGDLHKPFPQGVGNFCNILAGAKNLKQDVNVVFEVNSLEDTRQSVEAFSRLDLIA